MKTFTYYYKNQIHPEPLGKIKANNLGDAYDKACQIKQLDIKHFKEIFEIRIYEK
jgi:hypothetical protein